MYHKYAIPSFWLVLLVRTLCLVHGLDGRHTIHPAYTHIKSKGTKKHYWNVPNTVVLVAIYCYRWISAQLHGCKSQKSCNQLANKHRYLHSQFNTSLFLCALSSKCNLFIKSTTEEINYLKLYPVFIYAIFHCWADKLGSKLMRINNISFIDQTVYEIFDYLRIQKVNRSVVVR